MRNQGESIFFSYFLSVEHFWHKAIWQLASWAPLAPLEPLLFYSGPLPSKHLKLTFFFMLSKKIEFPSSPGTLGTKLELNYDSELRSLDSWKMELNKENTDDQHVVILFVRPKELDSKSKRVLV